MTMPDPREIRYRDQHEAATQHAHQVADSTKAMMAAELGSNFRSAGTGPVLERITARLGQLAAGHLIRPCPHIDLANPVPTYWTPGSAPDQINCAACNMAVTAAGWERASTQRDGAWNCDGCGQEYSRHTIGSGGIISLDTPPPIPPITATILLCRACAVEEGVPGAEL
jgi:hypothetical protein